MQPRHRSIVRPQVQLLEGPFFRARHYAVAALAAHEARERCLSWSAVPADHTWVEREGKRLRENIIRLGGQPVVDETYVPPASLQEARSEFVRLNAELQGLCLGGDDGVPEALVQVSSDEVRRQYLRLGRQMGMTMAEIAQDDNQEDEWQVRKALWIQQGGTVPPPAPEVAGHIPPRWTPWEGMTGHLTPGQEARRLAVEALNEHVRAVGSMMGWTPGTQGYRAWAAAREIHLQDALGRASALERAEVELAVFQRAEHERYVDQFQ